MKSVFLCLVTLSLGIYTSPQQETTIFNIAKPTGKITISPAEPTTRDVITFTVDVQDNSMTGLKRVVIIINDIEVKACLGSPCVYRGGPFPDGFLDDISFSMDRYADQDVEIVLQVRVLNASAQDLAV